MIAVAVGLLGCASSGKGASTPAPPPAVQLEATAASEGKIPAAELDDLVGRIALYPDELLALVLPAATQPLQIVRAARFLEARKAKPDLKPDPSWDPAVLSLLNYPDVIRLMDGDLDWMQKLGRAVTHQQADVMGAVQQVRAEALAAGNLETDAKQVVSEEKDVIQIESADPKVIYVPTYDPEEVVAPGSTTVVVYSDPYPTYWSPSATYFWGMTTGAAFYWALDWDDDEIYWGDLDDVDIDIDQDFDFDQDIDVDRPDRPERPERPERPTRPERPAQPAQLPSRPDNVWRPATRPTQPGVSRPAGPVTRPAPGSPSTRPAVPSTRPSTLPTTRPSTLPATRPGTYPGTRPTARPGDLSSPPARSSLGGYERGQDAIRSSQRGAASRGGYSGQRSAGGSSYKGGGFGGYEGGRSAAKSSSRGMSSRGGSYGGGSRGGGGRGGGGRGGGGRR